jgi:hypothetical protein
MKRIFAVVATALLLQACSRTSEDAALEGRWVDRIRPWGSTNDLMLEPDHRFSSDVFPLVLLCRFPESISDTRATGRWRYDRDARRIELDYDAPRLRKCKLPGPRTLIVDASGGETDLLIYPSGTDHLSDGVRLMRPIPAPSAPAAASVTNQVDCFRAGGKWEKWCRPNEYQCLMPYRDAGKACTDSSQCEGLCLVDTVSVCEAGKGCIDPVIPQTGQPFVGICQRDDASCGSFIEIHKGRAEPQYDVD